MDSQWGPETFGTKITNIVFFRIIRKKWVVPSTDVEPGPTRIPDHGSGKMRDASRRRATRRLAIRPMERCLGRSVTGSTWRRWREEHAQDPSRPLGLGLCAQSGEDQGELW